MVQIHSVLKHKLNDRKPKGSGDKMIFVFNLSNLFKAVAGLGIEFCFEF